MSDSDLVQRSEATLRSLLDNTPSMMGVVEVPPDASDILHIMDNAYAERLFGVGPGGTAGKWAMRDFGASPETIRQWSAAYIEAKRTGRPVRFPTVLEEPAPMPVAAPGSAAAKLWLDVSVSYIGPGAEGRDRFCYTALNDTERRRAEERDQFLIVLDDAVRPLTDPSEITLTAATLLGEHLGVDRCAYADIEADEDTMNLTGNYNRSPSIRSIVGRMKFSDFGVEVLQLMREDWPYVVDDVDTHAPPVSDLAAYRATQIQAVICVPLHKSGRFVASMAVHNATPRAWRFEEVELLRLVASRCWESIERSRVERDLRASEGRFRRIFDTAGVALFEEDFSEVRAAVDRMRADGVADVRAHLEQHPEVIERLVGLIRVLDVNDEAARMFGAPDKRALLGSLASIITRDTWPVFVDEVVAVAEGRDVMVSETRMRSLGGEQREVLFTIRFGEDLRSVLVSLVDLTARKAAEAERERLLESERRARAEAERASSLKDEFLATLSHELRTPLNAVLGWSQLIGRGMVTGDAVREGIRVIERNARLQAQLIEDLLDMSRIISGKLRLDVQQVNLAEVVEAACATVQPAADAKGVRLRKVLDPLAGPVSGDPGRLQQVVWNLLSNAVKFTPRGGSIEVLLERVSSHLEISVHDTGEGIKPDFLPHVFDRFRQADASPSRKHGGLGIGLSLVKQLVEMHGGTARAKSAGEGQGATFIVSLPLAPVRHLDAAEGQARRHPTAAVAEGSSLDDMPSLSGVQVLVVDDDADARDLLRSVLEAFGAQASAAASASEALEALTRARPHVLVSDIGMPGTDGYELIRQVRQLGAAEGGATPAIALTAFARSEDRRRAIAAGYQMHLAKPVEPSELVTMVASLAGIYPRAEPRIR
jgi:signal transduction histidine kinase/ActR/RegA family two-component response regulator